MQVVGRHARGRVLVERLVGREQQRQVAVEEVAKSLEPALEPLAAGAPEVSTGYIVERKSSASSPTSARIRTSRVSPAARASSARDPRPRRRALASAREAALAQDLDRRAAELLAHDRPPLRAVSLTQHYCCINESLPPGTTVDVSASGAGSAASASAGRRRTSRCSASSASSAAAGCSARRVRGRRSPPATCFPGPASTQLAIYCAWRAARARSARSSAALAFIVPGPRPDPRRSRRSSSPASPPALGARRRRRAPAPPSRPSPSRRLGPRARRAGPRARRAAVRWARLPRAGAAAAATVGPWLVLVLLACGAASSSASGARRGSRRRRPLPRRGGRDRRRLLALAWVAFKVGALSYGGGFVIVPLMQADAVDRYHWMTDASSSTPSRSARSHPGPSCTRSRSSATRPPASAAALLAAAVAFAPSFAFVLLGGGRFDALRDDRARPRVPRRRRARPRSARSSARRSRSRSRSHEPWQYARARAARARPARAAARCRAHAAARRGAVGVVVALLVTGSRESKSRAADPMITVCVAG